MCHSARHGASEHPPAFQYCAVQAEMSCAMQDCYLAYYLTELAGATFMIFTRTCDNTRKMALMLRNLGFDAIPIHGQMAQAKRIGALNKFKAGERSILVCTGSTVVLAAAAAFLWALVCSHVVAGQAFTAYRAALLCM